MEIKDRLKIALEEKNMKPTELAQATNITASSISDWLNGKYMPKADKIFVMAEVLGVSPAWLMGKDVPQAWSSNPYSLIQEYIKDLVDRGRITDIDSIPSSILIKLNELNTKCMIEFIQSEIRK
ncbi:helix-turn-helix transcriptional regulator [Clostridiaceae bacterium HFYG-1003]|nr:helix-turn-helix transcriptional regulator [Clostridiaceae bacterium HFYG-1003]